MELLIADEKAYTLVAQLSSSEALERAKAEKLSVLGSLSKLFFRPKEEDVQIVRSERRYEPFWHVVCHTNYVYDRRARFTLTASGKEVRSVTLDGIDQAQRVDEQQRLLLTGVEHCEEEITREVVIDAVTGEPRPWKPYLQYPKEEIENLRLPTLEDAVVVPPEVRASFVVRQLLSEMMMAVQADTIHKELVEIQAIDLYLRPLYVFEFHWAAKDKRVVAELDGLTGIMQVSNKAIGQSGGLSSMLKPELLFDVGADAVDLLVPGGGIALKVTRALVQKPQRS